MSEADPIDHASKTKGLLWITGACLLGLLLAFGISPLAHIIPWKWEQKMASAFEEGKPKSCHSNAQAKELLARLTTRLYPLRPDDEKISINVHVEKSPVVNAYAGLAGNITLTSGILLQAQSADEIAAVLAHEIEHVRHRHIMQAVLTRFLTVQGLQIIFSGDVSGADWPDFFLRMSFSRSQEAQADREGLRRLRAAHIDNAGFKNFFERMKEKDTPASFISDHPSNADRADMVDDFKNDDVQPIMSPAEWQVLRKYCQ